MHSISALVALSGALLLQHASAQQEVVFDCAQMPAVCTNMCWGMYCTFGDNDAEATLTYDAPDDATARARRVKAGCNPSGNRCAGGPPDANSCDEYPFASTEDADNVQQISRCVPQTENSRQGNKLSQFYPLLQPPEQFIVGIGNPGAAGVDFCNYGAACENDGSIFQGDDIAPNPPDDASLRKRYHYELASGMEYVSQLDDRVGHKVRRVVPALKARDGSSDEGEAWALEDDHVVAISNKTMAVL